MMSSALLSAVLQRKLQSRLRFFFLFFPDGLFWSNMLPTVGSLLDADTEQQQQFERDVGGLSVANAHSRGFLSTTHISATIIVVTAPSLRGRQTSCSPLSQLSPMKTEWLTQ